MRRNTSLRPAVLAAVLAIGVLIPVDAARAPIRGFTGAPALARAYDTILDADFDAMPAVLAKTCGPAGAAPEACALLDALAIWWRISLDPQSRLLDSAFSSRIERAIAASLAWTTREPERAEAWFGLGASFGARAQWRVLRRERLAAARDGKRIKEALERALALDPAMHDAQFGIGLYRYYAGVAPAALRMLRWLLLLPGGNRAEGLQQIETARNLGQLVRGEADYQLHLIYLWYEKRFRDALALVKGLQARYPRNPLFRQIEAEIHDEYFRDPAASLAASTELLRLAESRRIHHAPLASVVARLNIATQLDRLGQRTRAQEVLVRLIAEQPAAPAGALTRATTMLTSMRR